MLLKGYNFKIIFDIFNGIFIIVGFLIFVVLLFVVMILLCMMVDDGDVLKCFILKEGKKICWLVLGLMFVGFVLFIILFLVLFKNIYEYMMIVVGFMFLYIWLFILFFSKKLIDFEGMGKM